MRRVLAILLVVLALLTGCSRGSGTTSYTNEKHGYTVDYPARWQVNQAKIVPLPPDGTIFQGDNVSFDITVWGSPSNESEQASLRKDGWMEEEITVAGEKAKSFTRPGADRAHGVWRRVYFQHKGFAFQMSLNVYDEKQAEGAHKVFGDFVQSMRWAD
ncbi:MAG TPA: hypothetical protein VNT75_21670 [Symbiobacteriaceae bacterium]|nr:hypothetical protein [Symbiobacteriaceae bacterium]